MTPNERNIAIAEWRGWTQIENTNTISIDGIWRGYPPENAIVGKKELIPRYYDDLNAIYGAVNKLGSKMGEYICHLLGWPVDAFYVAFHLA